MNEFLMICERIVPKVVSVLKERYKILKPLSYEEPKWAGELKYCNGPS